MSEFDDLELERALRQRAGGGDPAGTDAAHSAVVARAGRVRRRRTLVAGGGVMAVLIVGGALVLGSGPDSVVTTPADRGADDTSLPSSPVTDGSVPSTVDRSITTATSTATSVVVDAPASTAPASTTPPPATTQATATPNTASATAVPDTTAASPSTTVPTTSAPPDVQTHPSNGGSITVRFEDGVLTLVSVDAAPGYTAEVEDNRPDRVRVRFRSDAGDSRIEVRVENGQLQEPRIDN